MAKCWNESKDNFNTAEARQEEPDGNEELAPDFDKIFRPSESATENTFSPLKGDDEAEIGTNKRARLSEENYKVATVQERFEALSETRQKCVKCFKGLSRDYRSTLNHEISCWRNSVLKCQICETPKRFVCIQSLRQHVKDTHPEARIPKFSMEDFEKYLCKANDQEPVKKPRKDDQISANDIKQVPTNHWLLSTSNKNGASKRRPVKRQRLSEFVYDEEEKAKENSPQNAYKIISDQKLKCLNCGDIVSKNIREKFSHEIRCWKGMVFKCFYCENPTPYICFRNLQGHVKKAHEGKEIPACNYAGVEKHLAEIGGERCMDLGTCVKCVKCGRTVLKTCWELHKVKCGVKDPSQNLSEERSKDFEADVTLGKGTAEGASEEIDPLQDLTEELSRPRIDRNKPAEENGNQGNCITTCRFEKLSDGRKKCSKCRRKMKDLKQILSHEVWCWRELILKCDICEEPKVFYRLDSLIKHIKDYHPGVAPPQPNREEIERYVAKVKTGEDGRYVDLGEKVKCTRCGLQSKKLTWQNHENKCWVTTSSSNNLTSQSVSGIDVSTNSSDVTENEFCPEIQEVFGNYKGDGEHVAGACNVVKLPILKSEKTIPANGRRRGSRSRG